MTISVIFTPSGPLFEKGKEDQIKQVIEKALAKVTAKQISIYRGLTPVRTGRLLRGWEERPIAGSTPTREIYNSVEYGVYVFARIGLLERTDDRAQAYLKKEVDAAIKKILG